MDKRTQKILAFSSNSLGFLNLSSNHLQDLHNYDSYMDEVERSYSFGTFPALFLFYHGLELLLKTYILLDGGNEKEAFGHAGKSDLVSILKKYRKPYQDKRLYEILYKYLNEEGVFFKKIQKCGYTGKIGSLYNDLRYLQNNIEYIDAHFWVDKTLSNNIIDDASTLRLKLVCRMKYFLKKIDRTI